MPGVVGEGAVLVSESHLGYVYVLQFDFSGETH